MSRKKVSIILSISNFLSQFFLKKLIMYYIIILSKKKLGSLAIFLTYFFSGGPKKFADPPRGQTIYFLDQIFFSCGCPYIVRKSQKNVYSFARSFLNGNIYKNQWVVSAPPVSDRVKAIVKR